MQCRNVLIVKSTRCYGERGEMRGQERYVIVDRNTLNIIDNNKRKGYPDYETAFKKYGDYKHKDSYKYRTAEQIAVDDALDKFIEEKVAGGQLVTTGKGEANVLKLGNNHGDEEE